MSRKTVDVYLSTYW